MNIAPSEPSLSPEQKRLAARLALETGITEAHAKVLVALGLDWSSLLREAKIIVKRGW